MRVLDAAAVQAAVLGGSILAGGGGGWVKAGLELGTLSVTYGRPRLASLDELPDDGLVLTVSQIGAPAAPEAHMEPRDFVRAAELLVRELGQPVVAAMTAQNGSSTTVHGWLHAAAMDGVVVADVAGDGRAHPTANMGAMGLAGRPDFLTIQAGAGGDRAAHRYVELVVRGSLALTARVVRQAAVEAGGFVANARTPLPVSFLRQHGAVGAISFALELGQVLLEAQPRGPEAMLEALGSRVDGRELARGRVRQRELETRNAYDLGRLVVEELELTVCNEYMTAERAGERLASFPDVLCTLSAATGLPISAADSRVGDEVVVVAIPGKNIPLGAGVRDPSVYPEVEQMIRKELAAYALAAAGA